MNTMVGGLVELGRLGPEDAWREQEELSRARTASVNTHRKERVFTMPTPRNGESIHDTHSVISLLIVMAW